MTQEVSTAVPQDPIENAAQEMYELKIGSLPVVAEEDQEKLLGIVTSSDVMRALVTLAGLPEPGCRIEVRAPDRAGILAEVVRKIHELEVDIFSVLSDPDRRSGGRTLVFQLTCVDPSRVMHRLKGAGYEVSWVSS